MTYIFGMYMAKYIKYYSSRNVDILKIYKISKFIFTLIGRYRSTYIDLTTSAFKSGLKKRKIK